MKRIYSLDFIKLLFAYIIALGHFGVIVPPGGGTTVQLFYIISGFFLARKFYSRSYSNQGKEYSQWNYTIDHVKSLYPHYLFSLIALAAYFFLIEALSFIRSPTLSQLSVIAKNLYELIPEMLLLQNAGFFGGGINYPLWQLCALVISGYFVYGLLCVNEKVSRELIFPASILMIQAFLKTDVDVWGTEGFFHVPLLRAFSPMCIGVLTYYFVTTEYYKRLREKKLFLNCASLISFICIFVFEGHRNIHLIVFVILLLAIYDSESWINKLLNRSIFRGFGNFSYAIYLNHALIKYILNLHIFPRITKFFDHTLLDWQKNVIFIAVLTVYSVITLFIVERLKQFFMQKKK